VTHDSLQRNYHLVSQSVATERAERAHLEQLLLENTAERDGLERQIAELKETLRGLGFSNSDFRKDNELRELRDQLEQKAAMVQGMKAEIAKKVKRLSELDAKHEERLKDKDKEIAILQADLKA
jgi:chromosome segregation ATPase